MSFTIQKDVSLAELTTLKIGGKAKLFASVEQENQVAKAFQYASENNLKTFIIGGGSNVLIADEGFDGLVLQIALKGISVEKKDGDFVFVEAKAGEDWDNFVGFCVENDFQGVECLSGIPGLIGGTPVQNVGAYGQEVSETIVSVRCFDRKEKSVVELTNGECEFAYRTSVFNRSKKHRYVVLAVTFVLKLSGEPQIVYRDLKQIFQDKKPTLRETREAVLKIRAEKSMVINPNDPNSQSAGSFFKNPIVTDSEFTEIENRAKELKVGNVPSFAVDEKLQKIPAAWLIEKSGFQKGFKFGRAGISSNHTLAIINLGGASAKDILALKDEIQTKVKEKFDVELKPEPVFVGFEND